MPSLLDIGHRAGMASGPVLYGAAGQVLVGAGAGLTATAPVRGPLLPTGIIAESYDRRMGVANLAYLTSGQLSMMGFAFYKGEIVTSVTFISGSTALSVGLNQWAALFDGSRVKLAISADDTSTAWAATTAKTFTMTTPYTIPATGFYPIGLMVKATTVPTVVGANTSSTLAWNLPPILTGKADAALTNPASCPSTASAITVGTVMPYCYVS